jgi:uncharacterized protein (DUF2249 family)
MTDLLLSSTEADAAAVRAIEQHHAELAGALGAHVEALIAAATRHDLDAAQAARERLVRWCQTELVPHAAAEEDALYPVAHGLTSGRLLIDGMLAEHVTLLVLVKEIAGAADVVRAAAAARSLEVLFGSHLRKENELILPMLAEAPQVSLAGLLEQMHEGLGHADDEAPAGGCGGHSCSCGEADAPGYPELDSRTVPHAIRHATIFGALDSVAPGGGLLLVASHEPLPLLAQVEQRWGGEFEIGYVERGPDVWRLIFLRRSAA